MRNPLKRLIEKFGWKRKEDSLQKVGPVRKLGKLRLFRTQSGDRIVVLPTCSVPLEHLIPENWGDKTQRGRFRSVLQIRALANGNPAGIFVKGVEGIFSRSRKKLEEGDILPRNDELLDQFVFTPSLPETKKAAERIALLEARTLLTLANAGANAERPQAIILHKDGRRQVVTKAIKGRQPDPLDDFSSLKKHFEKIRKLARKSGLIPGDIRHYNVVSSPWGRMHTIDVNRWQMAGKDKYYEGLVAALRKEIDLKREKMK